jgi:hypothetical protein
MRLAILLTCLAWLPLVDASTLVIDQSKLELRAQARACYLGFIKLYDVDYLVDQEDGRCVRVSYLRGFSADQLGEATTKVFAQRHGDEVAARYLDLLSGVNAVYAPVDDGDTYTYCVTKSTGGGLLLRDGQAVKRIPSDDFAERFMQIWVGGETPEGKPAWNFRSC